MLPARVGVAAIPPTAFYVDKEAGRRLVRGVGDHGWLVAWGHMKGFNVIQSGFPVVFEAEF